MGERSGIRRSPRLIGWGDSGRELRAGHAQGFTVGHTFEDLCRVGRGNRAQLIFDQPIVITGGHGDLGVAQIDALGILSAHHAQHVDIEGGAHLEGDVHALRRHIRPGK